MSSKLFFCFEYCHNQQCETGLHLSNELSFLTIGLKIVIIQIYSL